ncbi:hypothetical protein Rsub_03850 [Raphidocelis subcapitata]|uniref:Uncharacterized protein n=1 Tax=Raphidocelis subcapitata TaxID=307507 RepID=A0A2V0P1N3_9CHLO|nr:hypothetical protein Rsub_03850 [Raphidocelis subcapitata]|eukprot:GBF90995.1 hypothetical protein Rsub_03850 [Raphidocelis subcapitata]
MAGAQLAATLGALLLLHCIYAVAKYRNMLKLTQQEFGALPLALSAEVLLGAALAMVGGYGLAGRLKPIVITSGLSMDAGSFRPDFVSFNHRGKALPYNLPASL